MNKYCGITSIILVFIVGLFLASLKIVNFKPNVTQILSNVSTVDYEESVSNGDMANFNGTYEPTPSYVYCKENSYSLSSTCLCFLDVNSSVKDQILLSKFDNQNISKIKSGKCAMTFIDSGRMGNVIGQYAALYTLAKLNRRPALITPGMANVLTKYFKITIPRMSEELYQTIPWENKRIHDWWEDSYNHFKGTFVKLTGYPSSYSLLNQYEDEIKREFTLKDEIEQRAQDFLRNLAGNRTSTTFVGVHVRRGDYIHLMATSYHGVLADRAFFQEATEYFRSRYSDVMFVVVSNGMDWCKKNIPNDKNDVYYVGNNDESDPISDFAILMNCNHSIITVGTYSFFSAYFAGGDTVYLTNFTMPDSVWNTFFHWDTAFPQRWHPIAADLSPWYTTNVTTTKFLLN